MNRAHAYTWVQNLPGLINGTITNAHNQIRIILYVRNHIKMMKNAVKIHAQVKLVPKVWTMIPLQLIDKQLKLIITDHSTGSMYCTVQYCHIFQVIVVDGPKEKTCTQSHRITLHTLSTSTCVAWQPLQLGLEPYEYIQF